MSLENVWRLSGVLQDPPLREKTSGGLGVSGWFLADRPG